MIRTKQKAPVKRRGRRSENAGLVGAAAIASEQCASVVDVRIPGRVGRPPSGKIMVNLRLDPDVVVRFKATGKGWQARMNDALREAKL